MTHKVRQPPPAARQGASCHHTSQINHPAWQHPPRSVALHGSTPAQWAPSLLARAGPGQGWTRCLGRDHVVACMVFGLTITAQIGIC